VTGMLASIRDEEEARLVRRAGVDVIDLKNPAAGALGALETELVRRIVNRTDKGVPFSATIGDVPYRAPLIEPRIRAMAETGIDYVKVGVFGDPFDAAVLDMLQGFSQRGVQIILVLFAEDPLPRDLRYFADAGAAGVMLDTRDKRTGSLRDKLPDRRLQAFVRMARSAGLLCGLAGSLSETDVPALRALEADYLGFRGALCGEGRRSAALDAGLVRRLRVSVTDGGVSCCA
jgi:uncharacterized protein (UPF0264 family)